MRNWVGFNLLQQHNKTTRQISFFFFFSLSPVSEVRLDYNRVEKNDSWQRLHKLLPWMNGKEDG
jgi:hypothetical protein